MNLKPSWLGKNKSIIIKRRKMVGSVPEPGNLGVIKEVNWQESNMEEG